MASPYVDRRALLGAGLFLPAAMAMPNEAIAQQPMPDLNARLAPMARFIGNWRGEGEGQPGRSTVERTYVSVLGGHFIFVRNVSTYAPQARNTAGERHEDQGFYSFDRARNRVVLRQFHIESFFTQYVCSAEAALDGTDWVFDSEALENIPNGLRARESYRFTGTDTFEEIFEMSDPGDEWEVYSYNRLSRVV